MRSAYGTATVREVLSLNWQQVNAICDKIMRDNRERRRWDLMSRLAAASGGFNGGEALEFYKELMDSTYTPEDRAQQVEAEEKYAQDELARYREKRLIEINETNPDTLPAPIVDNWTGVRRAGAVQSPEQPTE